MMYSALSIIVLLAGNTVVGDADTTVPDLLNEATCPSTPVPARAKAIDYLGTLGPKRLGNNVPKVVTGLRGLLNSESTAAEADYLNWHVIQTLGKIGPSARPALPDIAKVKSLDPTLNAAIVAAVEVICAPPPVATPTSVPAPAPNPSTVVGLRLDLSSKSAATRIAALKTLAGLGKTAFPLLAEIQDLMKNPDDADVRRQAAETTKILVDIQVPTKQAAAAPAQADKAAKPPTPVAATDPASASNEEWLRIYVENLDWMLNGANHDQAERVFAVTALVNAVNNYSDVGSVSKYAKGSVLTAQSDADKVVQAIAKTVQFQPKTPDPSVVKPAVADPKPAEAAGTKPPGATECNGGG